MSHPPGDSTARPADAPFDAFYYANCCGRPYQRDEHWRAFFGRIADRIVADLAPKTVMDAGCAMGLLVEALRDRGVEAWGVDVSTYAIDRVAEPMKPFCRVGSIAEPFAQRYDLVVCIEVVEHMPSADADRAIANMCAHTDDVLFSSSPNDHRESSHVNVRPPEDWAERFASHRLFRNTEVDASFVSPWAVLFTKSSDPIHRLVRSFERRLARLEHERYDMRSFSAEAQGKQQAAEAALEHTRAELTAEIARLRAHVEALQAEVNPLKNALAQSKQESQALAERARFAEETIRNMEQSVFWRVRRLFRQ